MQQKGGGEGTTERFQIGRREDGKFGGCCAIPLPLKNPLLFKNLPAKSFAISPRLSQNWSSSSLYLLRTHTHRTVMDSGCLLQGSLENYILIIWAKEEEEARAERALTRCLLIIPLSFSQKNLSRQLLTWRGRRLTTAPRIPANWLWKKKPSFPSNHLSLSLLSSVRRHHESGKL